MLKHNGISKWHLVCSAMLAIALVSVATPSIGQERFPSKPITVIVPWGAGGGTDIVHRAAAKGAEAILGQRIVIVNKSGAAGVIGAKAVENAKPDGYTLGGIASTALLTQYTAQNPNSWKKMVPVTTVTYDAATLAVRSDSKFKSLKQVVEFAKANPGKLTVANGGAGGLHNMFAIALEQKAKVKFHHVSYKGGGAAVAAVLGGHVQAVTADVATTFPQVKAGQLQMLGIASNKPHASFSDVALYQDQGIGLTIGLWRLVVAPSGTPSAVIQILQDAYLKAIRTPEFRKVVGASLVLGLPSKEAARKMEEYSMTMKALVDKLDL